MVGQKSSACLWPKAGKRKEESLFFFLTLTAAKDKIAKIVSLNQICFVEKLWWEEFQNKKACAVKKEVTQTEEELSARSSLPITSSSLSILPKQQQALIQAQEKMSRRCMYSTVLE